MYIIEIPPLDDIQEGKVSCWVKHVSDPVQKGDLLVEIDTNTSHIEIESPTSGVLRAILVPENTFVAAGTFIALVGSADEAFPEPALLSKQMIAVRQQYTGQTSYEQHLGPEHPHTATSLNNLADLYKSQGWYARAEPLYLRALQIYEQHLGPEHPHTATSLNNLADLYENQGKYAEAEQLHLRALQIYKQHLGPEHP